MSNVYNYLKTSQNILKLVSFIPLQYFCENVVSMIILFQVTTKPKILSYICFA